MTDTPRLAGGLGLRDVLVLVLVLLAIIGMAFMDFSESGGFWYWLAMVPIFAALSLFMEWHGHRDAVGTRKVHLRAQVLHWLGAGVGVSLVFLLHSEGHLDRPTTGLVALLVLGLATLQAGLAANGRVALVGALLLATLAIAVTISRFFWVGLILAVVAIVILRFRRR